MPDIKPKEKRIDKIERLCKEADIPMTTLFRKADIPYNTISNWRKKEPDAFQNYDRLIETLESLKSEKEVPSEN